MIKAKLDQKQLAKSIKMWSKEFGETNEVALAKLSAETCRQLAGRVQPWGTGNKAKDKIVNAMRKDIRKSVRTVPVGYFGQLLAGEKRSVRWRHQWVTVRPDMLIRTSGQLLQHVSGLRSRRDGRVDKRQISVNNLKVASEREVEQATRRKAHKAGIGKGAWILAGRQLTDMFRSQASTARALKRQGIGVGYMRWAQDAARRAGVRGRATAMRSLWSPSMIITNPSYAVASERILKRSDIQPAIIRAFRKIKRSYEQAFWGNKKFGGK